MFLGIAHLIHSIGENAKITLSFFDIKKRKSTHELREFFKTVIWLVGWLVVLLFYGVPTIFGSFNAELSHFGKNFKQFSLVWVRFSLHSKMSRYFYFKQFNLAKIKIFVYAQLMKKQLISNNSI